MYVCMYVCMSGYYFTIKRLTFLAGKKFNIIPIL